jgi:predicted amidohydrolase YtcJ
MKLVHVGIMLCAAAGGARGAGAAVSEPSGAILAREPVTIILTHGRIHTPRGMDEALAISSHGLIVAVGSASDVAKLRGKTTKVVDLAGQAVLPGFNDMHVHPVFAGLQEQRCVVPQGSRLEALQAAVKRCVAKASPNEWITGGQWDASAIGRPPTRAMLDEVAPNNPVLLGDTSEHSAWANSRALSIAGVDRNTKDPSLGIVERDVQGEPTGVLREDAVMLVRRHVPPPTDAQIRAALKASADLMLSYGITAFTEAAAGYSSTVEKEVAAYAALSDSGALKQRVRLCLSWTPGNADSEAVIAARSVFARDRIAVDCVKIFLDGVPTDSHTAAMLEPYEGTVAGRTDEASRRGMLLLSQKTLDEAVTRFDSLGLAVKFHAAGDAAVRAGLNAIEAARRANGFSGVLHDVGHCTFVARQDIPRARAIGATFEVSPYLWDPSPINDDITAAVGMARIQRVWPVREMIDAGALVVPGSDWSVVPSVNPWIAVETLVTRENPGGSVRSFGKAEAISVKEAIQLFTVNSARHRHLEGSLGAIAPGMLADLIVLSKDPYEIPARELHEIKVITTFIGGEPVFQR